MRKSDLQNGMRVIFRNKEKYIIIGNLMHDDNWGLIQMYSYNEELKHSRAFEYGDSDWDIMEVHKSVNKGNPLDNSKFTKETLLWKRQELSEQDKKVIEAIRLLHPNHKWIARDRDNKLYACRTKPVKEPEYLDAFGMTSIDEEHLQFIQWDDEEPYYIGE